MNDTIELLILNSTVEINRNRSTVYAALVDLKTCAEKLLEELALLEEPANDDD